MARRVLVTRPKPGALATAERLAARGYEPVLLPLTAIAAIDPPPLADPVDAVIMTSANALRHLPDNLADRLRPYPLHVVGRRTGDAAQGWRVETVAPDGIALVSRLVASLRPGSVVAYPCGVYRRPELEAGLTAAGITILPLPVYDAPPSHPTQAEIGTILDGAPFWSALVHSPRGGELMADLLAQAEPEQFAQTVFVAISRAAAAPLDRAGRSTIVAAHPDEAHMIEALDAL